MMLVEEISIATGLGSSDIWRIIGNAPRRYKVFSIPKRSGGERIIAQPSSELKAIQRSLIELRLAALPVHFTAMAYEKGRGILQNAKAHTDGSAILKLDFKSFFPSITAKDWGSYCRKNHQDWIDSKEAHILLRILFWGVGSDTPVCLSIGAPTSPLLSNLIMYELDCKIYEVCNQSDVSYTRYADDITLSSKSIDSLISVEKKIRSLVRAERSPNLKFNDEKRGLYTRGTKRMVTGLVITPDGSISIGRDRKRMISSLIFSFSKSTIAAEDLAYLKGMFGFVVANEPAFLGSMRKKYGNIVIDRILALELPRREVAILPARTRKRNARVGAMNSALLLARLKLLGEDGS